MANTHTVSSQTCRQIVKGLIGAAALARPFSFATINSYRTVDMRAQRGREILGHWALCSGNQLGGHCISNSENAHVTLALKGLRLLWNYSRLLRSQENRID
jgi:hypothetical protein